MAFSINGVPITGNGGRVSNLTITPESASFDLTVFQGIKFTTVSGYTNLVEPGSSEISDRLVVSVVKGAPTYHVEFGSDPQLAAIPSGALDLTTVPVQYLPPNPYYEDGTLQYVGRLYDIGPGDTIDYFYIQSDVAEIPEPGSLLLLGTGLGWAAGVIRHKIGSSKRATLPFALPDNCRMKVTCPLSLP